MTQLTLATAKPYLQGIAIGHTQNLLKKEEDTLRMGVQRVGTTLTQTFQLHFACNQTAKLYNTVPRNFKVGRYSSYLLPALFTLATVKAEKIANPLLRRTVCFVHDHFGTLCHLITAIASAALIAVGQIALGATSLTLLGIGLLCRARVLSQPIRNAIDRGGFVVSVTTMLAFGGVVEKTFAVAEVVLRLIGFVAECRFKKQAAAFAKEGQPKEKKQKISFDQIPELDTTKCKIDRAHIKSCDFIPPVPKGVELKKLNVLFEKIDEKKFSALLQKKCEEDAIWQEKQKRLSEEKRKNIEKERVAHVKEGLKSIVNQITWKKLNAAEPKEYETIQKKAKHIALFLEKQDEHKRLSVLIEMALASYGCAGAPFRVIDEKYAELYRTKEELSLKEQIYFLLQTRRDIMFESMLMDMFAALHPKKKGLGRRILRDIFDPSDIHNYHLYLKLIGPEFGLSHASGANNDQIAMMNALDELFISSLYRPLRQKLWKAYTPALIKNEIDEAIRNQQIKTTQLTEGVLDWVGGDREKFETATEEVGGTHIALKEKYLYAYLHDIGVLNRAGPA